MRIFIEATGLDRALSMAAARRRRRQKMRGFLLVVAIVGLTASPAWAQNCNMINNLIYCDDGSTGNRIGNSTYWNDNSQPNRTDRSDEDSRVRGPIRPNQLPSSGEYDVGPPASTRGSTTYFDDGRVCTRVGGSIFCN
jgi:hypothetical protein